LFKITYYSNNEIAMSFGVLLDDQVLFQLCIGRQLLKSVNVFSVNNSTERTNAGIGRK